MGDDMPKYLNSPSRRLFQEHVIDHMDRAKEALRRQDFARHRRRIMDGMYRGWRAPAMQQTWWQLAARASLSAGSVVGELQRGAYVKYDPDTAGQTARSRSLLGAGLEHDFERPRAGAAKRLVNKKPTGLLIRGYAEKDEYLRCLRRKRRLCGLT